MNRLIWLAVTISLCFGSWAAAKERTWTDIDGRKMRAEFVREIDGEATFIKEGKIVTLPLDRLSAKDRQIIADLSAGKPVPDENGPPSASPAAADPVTGEPSAATEQAVGSPPGIPDRPGGPVPPRANGPIDSAPSTPLLNKPLPIENRTWTDIHGNQMTARYVRIYGENVALLRGGRSVTVRFYDLSAEDQTYLRELLASRGQEDLIPSPTAAASVAQQPGGNAPGNNAARPGPATNTPPGAPTQAGTPVPAVANTTPVPGGTPMGGPLPGSAISSPTTTTTERGPAGGGTLPNPNSIPGAMPAGVGTIAGGAPTMPAGPGSMPPGLGAGPPGFGASPPGIASIPPGMSMPGAAPPSFPSPTPAPSFPSTDSSFDRFQQQARESQQRQLDDLQRMQERLNQPLISHTEITGECSKCKRTLNEAQTKLTSCPHCGVRWDYEIDEYGNKRSINSGYSSPFSSRRTGGSAVDPATARTVGVVLGVFLGFAIVVGMIIGAIYIMMSIANASNTSRQRQYH